MTLTGAPTLMPAASSPVEGANIVSIHGMAVGKLAWIKSVQYSVDGSKDWSAAQPTDGLFDSTSEDFTLNTLPLSPGVHTIAIVALNAAGLSAKVTQTVTVH